MRLEWRIGRVWYLEVGRRCFTGLGEDDDLRGVNGESAASLIACRDVVRFDVKDDLDFEGVARSWVG